METKIATTVAQYNGRRSLERRKQNKNGNTSKQTEVEE